MQLAQVDKMVNSLKEQLPAKVHMTMYSAFANIHRSMYRATQMTSTDGGMPATSVPGVSAPYDTEAQAWGGHNLYGVPSQADVVHGVLCSG